MADPFVVDESFKRKILYLKVTELHTLLRNLGVSYQANKEQLVKRLILKYGQIYEQYKKGLVPYEEAKKYGDWINDNTLVYLPPNPTLPPPKPSSISITRTKPPTYGGDLSSYHSPNHYTPNSNNNNSYYNYNPYPQQQQQQVTSNGYSNSNGYKGPSYVNLSGSSKSTSIDITFKPPPIPEKELIFPKSADPFLEIETTLVSTRLKTYAESRGRPTSISFMVPESFLNSVRAGTSRVIVRSFEVVNNLAHVAVPHMWPPDCTLSVNSAYMALGIKKQTKPNAPPHPDKPLDISKEVRTGRNTMEVATSSSRSYAVVVDVMRVISVDTLVDVVRKNKTTPFESAKRTISLALGGDDKDIAALHTTVSLQCPLGRTPLVLPAKSLSCRHIQCFDLRNYLMMNQRTPSWKCPVCSTVANTTNLIIDSYFTELLRSVDSQTVSEVHIDPSGTWSTVKPRNTITPKAEPRSPVARAVSVAASTPTPSPQKQQKRVVEVVDLLSDDDDDVIAIPPKRAKPDITPQPIILINSPPLVSSSPPSPPLFTSFPSSSAIFVETTSTTTLPYPIISSPLTSPPLSPLSITSPTSNSKSPISTVEQTSPSAVSPSSSPTSDRPPSVPIITSPPDNTLQPPAVSEETNFEPNLQSDLASPITSSDTPPKKNAIIVKLRLSQKPLPPPLSSQALGQITSPNPPAPPPTSVPSESSDSVSSLEVPNLADPYSSVLAHSSPMYYDPTLPPTAPSVSSTTISSTTTTTTTTTTTEGTVSTTTTSSFHADGSSVVQPVIVLSDDEDPEHSGDFV